MRLLAVGLWRLVAGLRLLAVDLELLASGLELLAVEGLRLFSIHDPDKSAFNFNGTRRKNRSKPLLGDPGVIANITDTQNYTTDLR